MTYKPTASISPEIARAALAFLQRTQIVGAEIDAYMQVHVALKAIAEGHPAPAVYRDGAEDDAEAGAHRSMS
jgi:hypothetical protein